MTRHHSWPVFVVLCGALVAAGCSSSAQTGPEEGKLATATSAPLATRSAALQGCTDSPVPMWRMKAHAAGEPTIAIPQPPGWERSNAVSSDIIYGAILNASLRANDFTPNAVVTLENLTGKVGTAAQALNAYRAALGQEGIAATSDTPGSQCGYPSTTLTYVLDRRPVTMLIVAAEHNDAVWASTLALQTTEPYKPAYLNDKKTILDGFQFQFTQDNRSVSEGRVPKPENQDTTTENPRVTSSGESPPHRTQP